MDTEFKDDKNKKIENNQSGNSPGEDASGPVNNIEHRNEPEALSTGDKEPVKHTGHHDPAITTSGIRPPDNPGLKGGIGCAVIFGFFVVGLIISVIFVSFGTAEDARNEYFELSHFIFYLGLGAVVVFIMLAFQIDFRTTTGSVEHFRQNIKLAGWFLPLIIISLGTSYVIMIVLGSIDESLFYAYVEFEEKIFEIPDEQKLWLHMVNIASVVILAPVIEESVFRGLLMSSWSVKWGNSMGIFLSSLVFGIFHIDPIGAFIFGVALCIIYFHTGSLLLVIFIHMLNNALAALLMYTMPDYMKTETLSDVHQEIWFIGPLMLISILVLWPFLKRIWPANDRLPPAAREEIL